VGTGDVVVTNGGKQALHTAILALFEEGDDVLVPVPYWVSFPEMVKLSGRVPSSCRPRLRSASA